MNDLIIDRKKWARGGNGGLSSLLNDDGNMCCLGFAAIQITGLTEEQIQGFGQYEELIDETAFLLENGTPFCEPYEGEHDYDPVIADTKFHSDAIRLNDYKLQYSNDPIGDVFIKDEVDREEQLTKLFKENGIDVTFIN